MIVVYANCNVSDDNIEKYIALAETLIEATRKEAGNISYELIRGMENRNLFAFLERWEDKDVLATHMNTNHFKTIVPQLGDLVDGDMQINVHEIVI
ncbi:MAG: putative monooxygenase [Firmicutes bacterium]|nr:putative monooxygenase [Bacillota bacterium]